MFGRVHLLIADSINTPVLGDELRTPSTDIRHIITDKLSIKEVRSLKEESVRLPLSRPVLSFVIVAGSIEIEAQNALLKLFEEPPSHTEFFLITPHESRLLPTLRSRFVDIDKDNDLEDTLAKEFLAMNYKDRLEYIAAEQKKDTDSLRKLFTSLSHYPFTDHSAKKSLLLVSRYVYNRGAGLKMLMEELALSLPQK